MDLASRYKVKIFFDCELNSAVRFSNGCNFLEESVSHWLGVDFDMIFSSFSRL